MDLSKLLSLVSTRAAAGIAVAALAAGTGSAVVLTTRPASSHSNQTVLSVESTNSTNSSDADSSNSSEDTTESSDASNSSNTTNHGDVVTAAVSSCKSSAAAANTHGIGDCVSDVASTNGQAHRHSASSSSSSSNR